MTTLNRRDFVKTSSAAVAALALTGSQANTPPKKLFDISLAQWSLHQMLRTRTGEKLDNLDFATFAKNEFGITAVEYVDQFFRDKAKDKKYIAQMKKRCSDNGITSVLIMVDTAGRLGTPDANKRTQAIENHKQWVEAAKELGCHSIRVNASSHGDFDEQMKLAADGLGRLGDWAYSTHRMNVIVENHGGLSSNGQWLSGVMKMIDKDYVGTLPDFGNFKISKGNWYDRYRGIDEMMPFAKGVSAKSHSFHKNNGEERGTDYRKMLDIVVNKHNYHGYIGVEYEGSNEVKGIKLTKALLEKVRAEMMAKKG